jgi:glycosyltransferase involved in cell wall biosynthesis
MGQVDPQTKSDLLSKARAFLMPIQWEEPFGLVMVEALASGTPVVALNRGAVPEVVDDGVTGYVCDSVDAMIEAIGRLDEIDAAACRRQAQIRFDASVTVEGYERVYRSILAGRPEQERTRWRGP